MNYTSTSKTANVQITRKRGDSFYYAFQVSIMNGAYKVPVDLSIYTNATMKVRQFEYSEPLLIFTSTGTTNTIDITYLIRGQIIIEGDEIALYPNHYLYDLQLSNTNTTETIISGKFIIEPEITY